MAASDLLGLDDLEADPPRVALVRGAVAAVRSNARLIMEDPDAWADRASAFDLELSDRGRSGQVDMADIFARAAALAAAVITGPPQPDGIALPDGAADSATNPLTKHDWDQFLSRAREGDVTEAVGGLSRRLGVPAGALIPPSVRARPALWPRLRNVRTPNGVALMVLLDDAFPTDGPPNPDPQAVHDLQAAVDKRVPVGDVRATGAALSEALGVDPDEYYYEAPGASGECRPSAAFDAIAMAEYLHLPLEIVVPRSQQIEGRRVGRHEILEMARVLKDARTNLQQPDQACRWLDRVLGKQASQRERCEFVWAAFGQPDPAPPPGVREVAHSWFGLGRFAGVPLACFEPAADRTTYPAFARLLPDLSGRGPAFTIAEFSSRNPNVVEIVEALMAVRPAPWSSALRKMWVDNYDDLWAGTLVPSAELATLLSNTYKVPADIFYSPGVRRLRDALQATAGDVDMALEYAYEGKEAVSPSEVVERFRDIIGAAQDPSVDLQVARQTVEAELTKVGVDPDRFRSFCHYTGELTTAELRALPQAMGALLGVQGSFDPGIHYSPPGHRLV